MKEIHKARCIEAVQYFLALFPRVLLSLCLQLFSNLECLLSLIFKIFMKASWHRQDWLTHWPFGTNSASSPSPIPGSQWWGWKLQLSHQQLATRATNPTNRWGPKVIINMTMIPFCPHHLGNSKGLESSLPKWGHKINCIFLTIKASITLAVKQQRN